MKVSDELYNPGPLLTFEGAAIAVLTTSGAVGYALDFNPKWLGLLIALAIPFGGLLLLPDDSDVWRSRKAAVSLIALFHGLVIYNLSVGLNAVHQATSKPSARAATMVPIVDPVPWWTSAEQERAARALIVAVRSLKSQNSEDLESVTTLAQSVRELQTTESPELVLRRLDLAIARRHQLSGDPGNVVVPASARGTLSSPSTNLATLEKLADDLERAYSGSGRQPK